MNRSRCLGLASVCILISLSPRVFGRPDSGGSTGKTASAADDKPIQFTLDTASYTTLIGGR
jgi:hypothetical protein